MDSLALRWTGMVQVLGVATSMIWKVCFKKIGL